MNLLVWFRATLTDKDILSLLVKQASQKDLWRRVVDLHKAGEGMHRSTVGQIFYELVLRLFSEVDTQPR